MKVDVEMVDNVAVIILTGELDSRGHHLLDNAFKDLISQQCFNVILDLTSIRFFGNQTVSLLLSHMKDQRANQGDIKFLNPHRMLLSHLKKNRITELFKIFSTKAEAINSFTTDPPPAPSSPPPSTQSAAARSQENAAVSPVMSEPVQANADPNESIQSQFDSGAILFANSCMLAALIKVLEAKHLITTEEASDLMDYERLSLKGVSE